MYTTVVREYALQSPRMGDYITTVQPGGEHDAQALHPDLGGNPGGETKKISC